MIKIDSLLNLVSESRKSLLVTFLVSLPIVYSVLFLFVEGYSDFDFIERVIFAIASTIAGIGLTLFAFIVSNKGVINNEYAYYFIWTICFTLIVSSIFSIFTKIGVVGVISQLVFPYLLIFIVNTKQNKSKNKTGSENIKE